MPNNTTDEVQNNVVKFFCKYAECGERNNADVKCQRLVNDPSGNTKGCVEYGELSVGMDEVDHAGGELASLNHSFLSWLQCCVGGAIVWVYNGAKSAICS